MRSETTGTQPTAARLPSESRAAARELARGRNSVVHSTMPMRFDIVTIFPEFFGAPGVRNEPAGAQMPVSAGMSAPGGVTPGAGIFGHGILERALRSGSVEARTHDLRAFTHDRHRTVDDRPFGGGEGMVLKAQPILECVRSLQLAPGDRVASGEWVVLLSAQGKQFTQATARRLAGLRRVVLLCGRYEGVDERVSEQLCDEELSIGDYVLSGGELAAAVVIDAVVRLLPGVLGHADSSRFESFGESYAASNDGGLPQATHAAGGLLDYPQYTRPAEWLGQRIPAVLGEGDHLAIRRWRRQAALTKTWTNRPDLLEKAALSDDDREFLAKLGFSP